MSAAEKKPSQVPYVSNAAVVQDGAAVALGILLHFAVTRGGMTVVPESLQSLARSGIAAIDLASRVHMRRTAASVSAHGSNPARLEASAAQSLHEPITTAEAGLILGVSERRVRDLAAAGLGFKVAGRWVLDRAAVESAREERDFR